MQGGNGATRDLSALRDSLERDGYAILDLGLDDTVLDRAVSEVEPLFRPEGGMARAIRRGRRAVLGRHTAISHRDERRVQDAWIVSPDVNAIATAPAVLDLLRETYGREPLPFQTLNFKFGSEQRPHSDAMHFNSEPSGFMCGVWLALEDIGPEQGPVVYFPGSHKLEEVTAGDIEGTHSDYEDFVSAVIAREGLEERAALLRRGEALIWSANLIHGGSPQRDRSLTRWSQVTHYFFEDCRYWKPLDSRGGERAYWTPTWVR
jgi:ectoine hydroxylase-related dioxygenase (phytanoyl-CoA dioxygenase family)